EPVKLCVADNRIVEFRKQVKPDLEYDFQGESVGFFRFTSETAKRLIKACNDYLDQGEQQTPYEECIRDLLLETPEEFGYEDVSDLGWVEIDFPEDITRAEQEILPKIEQIN
ncbi:MAG: phosphocholine cytidylyltransferase family protein, partial [Gammaproteobacteria bacterium]